MLFAHPSIDRSEVNRPLVEAALKVDGITLVDLYAEYPQFDIDIEREQRRLLEHDVIIFMHPFYWYSTPAILKEWQDLVLEYGFAYGEHGTALHGKALMCALTAGGSQKGYCHKGYNHFTVRELLQPIEQTANLCGMTYLAPFALFGARTAVDEGRVEAHVAKYVRLLEALRDDRVDLQKANQAMMVSNDLDAVMKDAASPGGAP